MHILRIHSLQQTDQVSARFLKIAGNRRKFAFTGAMGSGKTTLITAICRQLGVVSRVTSPSFALVNEYRTASGEVIFHFDFYRIRSIEEAFDLGYEEYFYSDAWCFIEWAEKAAEILPDDFVRVNIEVQKDNTRQIRVRL
ncbi:MAG: tRNA (adenosine(37)-N6)-threonylcarbamoyltransferase complex ATPase subunit type 1 TsaE [Bacteroidetes bacterium RBG_13_46_8]|nr:MAG: tRNA (adenosine(37)-N6)-threonylcarbamoyltransferase complex ATPase subunit type 1 TsaE [Bacteroidetes bacterium RBG_13_46_8]